MFRNVKILGKHQNSTWHFPLKIIEKSLNLVGFSENVGEFSLHIYNKCWTRGSGQAI